MEASKTLNAILACLYLIVAVQTIVSPRMWNKWCLAGLFVAWSLQCAMKVCKNDKKE